MCVGVWYCLVYLPIQVVNKTLETGKMGIHRHHTLVGSGSDNALVTEFQLSMLALLYRVGRHRGCCVPIVCVFIVRVSEVAHCLSCVCARVCVVCACVRVSMCSLLGRTCVF